MAVNLIYLAVMALPNLCHIIYCGASPHDFESVYATKDKTQGKKYPMKVLFDKQPLYQSTYSMSL
jgi:hypothetical protein